LLLISIISTTITAVNIAGDSLINKESLFADNLLKPIHEYPIFSNATIIIWPLIVFLVVLIIYVSASISNPKKFFDLLSSSFSLQASKQLFREDYKLNKRIPIFFTINFILVFSFLAFKTNEYFNKALVSEYSTIIQYLFFVTIVLMAYSTKFLVISFLSFFLKIEDLGREYLFNVLVFCHSLSFIIYPFVIFLQFSKVPSHYFLYPALIISGGFYLLRLIRTLYIAYAEQNIRIIHIFMYLCALEILPLLLLVKFLFLNF
jgi:hypothetical protein